MDPVARRHFWDLLYDLAGQGVTLFVTTHYMEEAAQCGRLAFMYAGRLIAEGSPREIREHYLREVGDLDERRPAENGEHRRRVRAPRDTRARGSAAMNDRPAAPSQPMPRSVTPPGPTLPPFFAEVEPGRKGEILDSALHVFAEHGYDNGSMREIAKGVGVSEPALYRHFPGKEALFLALIRAGAGRMRKEGFALIDDLRPETVRAQLLGMFDNRRRALRLNAPMLRAVIPAAARNTVFLDAFRSEIAEPILGRLAEKAVELDAAFEVPAADATRDARVRALLALVVGGFLSSMVLGDRPDEAIVDAALRVMGWSA